jgi:hypothetical protein
MSKSPFHVVGFLRPVARVCCYVARWRKKLA